MDATTGAWTDMKRRSKALKLDKYCKRDDSARKKIVQNANDIF